MTADQVVSLVIGLMVLAGALLLLRSARRTRVTERQLERAERYLMQRDLPTDPELVVLTMRLQAVPDRAGRQMCGIAMSIGAVVLALLPYLPGGAWPAIGGPLLIMLCVPVFAVLYARGVSRHVPRAGGPHVAHAARPRITDYVPPLLWWWPLVSVAIAGVPAADYAVHPPVVASVPASVVVATWALAALAEATIMALVCWLAGRPQPAATSDELAVRNEITSDVLCRLLAVPVAGWALFWTGHDSLAALNTAALLMAAQYFVGGRRRRVRKRLRTARPRPPHPPLPLAGS